MTTEPAPSGLFSKLHTALLYILLGYLLAGGAIRLPYGPGPAPDPKPAPKPEPDKPDWLGGVPGKPVPLEWRPLPAAPGWEGLGRDVDGRFLFEYWRRIGQ